MEFLAIEYWSQLTTEYEQLNFEMNMGAKAGLIQGNNANQIWVAECEAL
jgi:hypothetical protein